MSDWVKLERQNDWSIEYLAERGKGLRNGTACKRTLGLRFEEGQRLRARWPDGTEVVVAVAMQTRRDSYEDHGHRSDVKYEFPCVNVDVHGTAMMLPLDTLEVWREDLPPVGAPEAGR